MKKVKQYHTEIEITTDYELDDDITDSLSEDLVQFFDDFFVDEEGEPLEVESYVDDILDNGNESIVLYIVEKNICNKHKSIITKELKAIFDSYKLCIKVKYNKLELKRRKK
jgi:hypothetical protein